MKSQSRPFVVEIKRSKRAPLPAEGDAPARKGAVPAAGWSQLAAEAEFAAGNSPARKAAEAFFSPPRPALAEFDDETSANRSRREAAMAPAQRVLFAVDPEPMVDAPVEIEPPVIPSFVPVAAPAARRPERKPVEAPVFIQTPDRPEPIPVAQAVHAEAGTETADRTRRMASRRVKDELPLGQRWKRRLPKACR